MRMPIKLAGAAALVAVLGAGVYTFAAHSQDFHGPFGRHGMMGMGPGMMGMSPGMMGSGPMGPGMMGMAQDPATAAQLQVIHTMFINHDRIKRTVTNLPNGIRTLTESDDPQLAEQIKSHVAAMKGRVDAGDDPGLPIESDSLHAIFRNNDKIKTSYETTDKGVAIVQTSDDPDTVSQLQTHAAEVSEFVRGGMASLHAMMMKKHGGMGMPMMMHGGMMHGGPI